MRNSTTMTRNINGIIFLVGVFIMVALIIVWSNTKKTNLLDKAYLFEYIELEEYDSKDLDIKFGENDSVLKVFDPEGTLLISANFQNHILDGDAFVYYKNNTLRAKLNFKNNKLISDNYYFYPNGFLSKYIYFDEMSKARYGRYYDSSGHVHEENGHPIVNFITNDSIFQLHDTFMVKLKTISIPRSKIELIAFSNFGGGEDSIVVTPLNVEEGYVLHKEVLKKPGEFYFQVKYLVKDSFTSQVNEFNREVHFTVY